MYQVGLEWVAVWLAGGLAGWLASWLICWVATGWLAVLLVMRRMPALLREQN